MGLKCGIVGLPNVGKSTLFNALTKAHAAAANYPFCTIEPNIGVAELPDARLAQIAAVARSKKIVPATVEFVDIAGLVKGAADNAGLGNRFLAHIRETDGIAHVTRCFEDRDIAHVNGTVSPADDIAIVNLELALADLTTVEKARARAQRAGKSGDKESRQLELVCGKLERHLQTGRMARTLDLDKEESRLARSLCLLTLKPMLYVANVAETGFSDNPMLQMVTRLAEAENAATVAICAQTEADIADFSDEEKAAFLRDLGQQDTGLSRLAAAAFALMGLTTYFTAGETETRAWTIRCGMNAGQAAGVIHTDFERGFIRAEVCSWRDYTEHRGDAGARAAGKARLEGKEYIVQEGDIMHFRFNR